MWQSWVFFLLGWAFPMRVHPIDPFFDTRYLIDQSNRCGPSPHHPFFVVRRHPAEPHSRTKPNACFHRTQRMDMRAHTHTHSSFMHLL